MLPNFEHNNVERKLLLKAGYAERGEPGPMVERKYSCPRNRLCPSPQSSSPPQRFQGKEPAGVAPTNCTCSVPPPAALLCSFWLDSLFLVTSKECGHTGKFVCCSQLSSGVSPSILELKNDQS